MSEHDECGRWGWWEERNLGEKIVVGIGLGIVGLAAAAGLFFLFGWVVMSLWNWLMPEIFGLGTVTYWQAWGLLVLSSILFKGFGGSGDGGGKRSDRKRRKTLKKYIDKEIERETTPL